jgi:transaldolase
MKLFADGADFDGIIEAAKDPDITGFTTNPTLMRKAGVTDYEAFAKTTIKYLKNTRPDTCLSLEVFADDPADMIRQARIIDSWASGYKVYIKIPVVNTKNVFMGEVIQTLSAEGIPINVTAILAKKQVEDILAVIDKTTDSIISVFAGRIADLGYDANIEMNDYMDMVHEACSNYKDRKVKLLWASPREAYNYVDAYHCGVDIITMTPDLIKKVKGFKKKTVEQFSLETVQMFYNDAVASGFKI